MLQLVRRHPRWLAAAAVAVAIAGAVLMWGPVGLGNGPLWVVRGGDFGWGEPQTGATAVAYVVPVGNAGPGVAVIDGVSVISIRHYAGTFPQGDNTTCRAGEKAAGPT